MLIYILHLHWHTFAITRDPNMVGMVDGNNVYIYNGLNIAFTYPIQGHRGHGTYLRQHSVKSRVTSWMGCQSLTGYTHMLTFTFTITIMISIWKMSYLIDFYHLCELKHICTQVYWRQFKSVINSFSKVKGLHYWCKLAICKKRHCLAQSSEKLPASKFSAFLL